MTVMTLFYDSDSVVFAECDDDRAAQTDRKACPGRSADLECTCRCHAEDTTQPGNPWQQ
ncbi:hypothetical protein ACFQ7B_33250 [Streptomyces erythrochromogenes]|uniref:hypothetical protein n=1 Tax=Streptomyces erythrochromogenes TaxID=285574 RepID=UPI0036B90118